MSEQAHASPGVGREEAGHRHGAASEGSLLRHLSAMAAELGPWLDVERGGRAPPLSATGLTTTVRFSSCRRAVTTANVLDAPWLTLVLMGGVVARSAGTSVRAQAGQVLWLPSRTSLELTLIPASDARQYLALDVELLAEALVRWLPTDLALGGMISARPALRVPGRAALVELVRFCEGVLERTTHPLMLEHQLGGFLLALALEEGRHGLQLDSARAQLDPILASRHLVRADPDRRWSLPETARRLGLSASTLRRRLSQRGTGLRRIVNEERMLIARTLLGDGRLNVTEVAARCGYDSPSKFSRRFRHAFGVLPSKYRPGRLH